MIRTHLDRKSAASKQLSRAPSLAKAHLRSTLLHLLLDLHRLVARATSGTVESKRVSFDHAADSDSGHCEELEGEREKRARLQAQREPQCLQPSEHPRTGDRHKHVGALVRRTRLSGAAMRCKCRRGQCWLRRRVPRCFVRGTRAIWQSHTWEVTRPPRNTKVRASLNLSTKDTKIGVLRELWAQINLQTLQRCHDEHKGWLSLKIVPLLVTTAGCHTTLIHVLSSCNHHGNRRTESRIGRRATPS